MATSDKPSTELVKAATPGRAKPMRHRAAPRWLRWLARLPGRLASPLTLGAAEPVDDHPDLDEVAALARRSPRGAGYLSLEPGLHRVHTDGVLLSYQTWRRTAFATGGLHGAERGGAGGLLATRERLADGGFRRLLLFPVADGELELLRRAGLRALEVGAEAFVAPRDFSLRGGRMADVRSMCNRADRGGITAREADPATDRQGLQAVYDAWSHHFPSGRSMRLLIGSPCFERPLGRRYFVAEQGDDRRAVAFVTLTPGWSGRGWGLDVLARHPDAPPGAMDRLLVSVIERLADEDVERLSLGACPMLEVPGRPRKGPLGAFFRHLYRARWSNRLFPFQGLAYFKNKFAPTWEPVHIAGWPRVGVWGLYVGCLLWGLFE